MGRGLPGVMWWVGALALAFGSTAGASIAAPIKSRYFLIVYGFEAAVVQNIPKYSHTWAAVIKIKGQNPLRDPLEVLTLSWDAASGSIGSIRLPEPGKLYDQVETVRLAAKQNVPVIIKRMPIVEITKMIFDQILAQKALIKGESEQGRLLYLMLDNKLSRRRLRDHQAGALINCQHVLTDIIYATNDEPIGTGNLYGYEASVNAFWWLVDGGGGVDLNRTWDKELMPRLGSEFQADLIPRG